MQHKLSGYGVDLRSVLQSDIETLRQWRNRDDIRSMMKSTAYITPEQQQSWFEGLEDATHVRHFLVSYRDEAIGSATLSGLSFVSGFTDDLENAKEIEPGLYIGHERYRNNILAFAPSLVVCDYCFDELQVSKLIATVNASNKAALSYNKKLGYQEESRFYTDVSQVNSIGKPANSESISDNTFFNEEAANKELSDKALIGKEPMLRQEWVSLSLQRKDYIAATKQVRDFLSRRST